VEKRVKESFRIVQLSDMHCGDSRFDHDLMIEALGEINRLRPDMVIVAGDLTEGGYREEFDQAKDYINLIECPQKVVIAGNHDCRNVGYLHFEDLIGPRYQTVSFDFCVYCGPVFQEKVKIVAVDSNKPDLNEGEIGRDHYTWIDEEFQGKEEYKVFVLHHHLVSVPGTGRERNIVWDAGDVLERLQEAKVDLVLAGHRHVPWVWPVAGMLILNSGTVSTWRTRGYTKPSYNVIEITSEKIAIAIRESRGKEKRELNFPRILREELEPKT
jgi:3',5'-cyclic AMP phosphodiesterase CpdA